MTFDGITMTSLTGWFPGFFLYSPHRKQQPAALTAVIDIFRRVAMDTTEAVRVSAAFAMVVGAEKGIDSNDF